MVSTPVLHHRSHPLPASLSLGEVDTRGPGLTWTMTRATASPSAYTSRSKVIIPMVSSGVIVSPRVITTDSRRRCAFPLDLGAPVNLWREPLYPSLGPDVPHNHRMSATAILPLASARPPCCDHPFLPGRMAETMTRAGRRATPRMFSRCRINARAIPLRPLVPILEPSRGRSVGGATGGSSGCADLHKMAGEPVVMRPRRSPHAGPRRGDGQSWAPCVDL
jgi:hypothetical protein